MVVHQKTAAMDYCQKKIDDKNVDEKSKQNYRKIKENIQNKDFSNWESNSTIIEIVENSMKNFENRKL
jgi:hypothetical protein